MKMDADERGVAGVRRAGRMEVSQGWQARACPVLPLREGHVPQGPAAEHPVVEQGPGSNSEAGTGGGTSVPDLDRQRVAQVRGGTTQGDSVS